MAEWFEDESLWIETYPFTFSEQRFAMVEISKGWLMASIYLKRTTLAKPSVAIMKVRRPSGRPFTTVSDVQNA